MVNKRGYSFGPEFPFHFESRSDGWAVFDARDDVDFATGLKAWDAYKIAYEKNGSPKPDLEEFDRTP